MTMNMKWKYEPYAFYNKNGIEDRLGEMAEQGWFIEKMGFFWKYRKGVPAKRIYNVVYMEDPDTEKKKEKQKEFVEYCDAAGWELICVQKDMLVFSHAGENPVPIETDVEMELESIDKVMRSSYLQTYSWWILWAFMNLVQIYHDYGETPFEVMASTNSLIVIAIIAAMPFFLLDGWYYLSWMKKARIYAKDCGLMLLSPERRIYKYLTDWMKQALCLCLFIPLFLNLDLILLCFIFVFMGLVLIGHLGARKKEERRRCFLKEIAYKKNRKREIGVVLAAIALLWCCFTLVGSDWSTARDIARAPVSLRDLISTTSVEKEHAAYYVSESVFAKRIDFYHSVSDKYNDLELEYVYGKVKTDSLYEKGKSAFFKEEDIFILSYKVLDADAYGAKEAYYKPTGTEGNPSVEYVFVWDDAFAKVEFEGKPTNEQIKIVADKLGKIK